MNKLILMPALTLAIPVCLLAQEQNAVPKDTVPSTKEVKNRNVMLNASSDNQPRTISIGLPATNTGVTIFENGLPVAYSSWPCMAYMFWAGTASYGHTALMSLSESTLKNGEVGYIVDSYTREGGEQFKGILDYTANHFGMQRFDLNVSGPIAKGWSYTLGSYQNFDPGTNHQTFASIQNRMQIYKAGLTKVWNEGRGKASLFYRYSSTRDLGDNNGPFYYNGDGSVTLMDGFDLGKDPYLPTDDHIALMDVMTGQMKTVRFSRGNHSYGNDLNFNLNYRFRSGSELTVRSRYKHGNSRMITPNIAGLDNVGGNDGYTTTDGKSYSGNVQQRFMKNDIGFERSWLTNAELTGKSHGGGHSWRIGLNEFYNRAGIESSTGMMAHTVSANPEWLLWNGNRSWGYNTGAEYYNGHENKLALYLSDDWQATRRLWMSIGARLEYQNIGGRAAFNEGDATNNDRVTDFNLKQKGTIINRFEGNWLNPAFTFNGRYTILNGFGIMGEYVYNRTRPNLQDYAGANYPIQKPVNVHMARAGLFYNTPWMQLVSQFSYITQTNYKSRSQFTKQINGQSETVVEAVTYDVATIGWTTDVVLTPFKGFSFHGLFTLQDPLYKNFVIAPHFSDGSHDTYDFSNKNATGISKVIVELDPSYTIDKWRIWASFRYQSKQYINKTNSLYFNGRWETFAGVDYTVNKNLGFSINAVNFLNQKGASGSISAADLVEDNSGYRNYLMAGNYIRPFTMEFAAHINF